MWVYLTIVLVFCALFPLVPRRHIKWLFAALVLAMSITAFKMVPNPTDDLVKYFNVINALRDGGWSKLQSMIKAGDYNWDTLPLCGCYFYFIGMFNENSLLPALTIFLSYGSMFLVLWRAANRFEVGKWYLFLGTFFILSTYWFYDIASGIRNGLVYTLMCAYAYFDFVENRNKIICWLGYISLLLFHSSMIMPIFVIVLLKITKRLPSGLMSTALAGITVLGGFLLPILGDITGIEYLQVVSDKAEREMNRFGLNTDTGFLVNISVFIVTALLMMYCHNMIKKAAQINEKFEDMLVYDKLCQYMMMFIMGSVFTPLIFLRWARWVVPIMGAIVFMVGMQAGSCVKEQLRVGKKQGSVVKSRMVVSSNEMILNFCFILYTGIHLWYVCNGSSLIWLKFS